MFDCNHSSYFEYLVEFFLFCKMFIIWLFAWLVLLPICRQKDQKKEYSMNDTEKYIRWYGSDFWSAEECGILYSCHYFQINSGKECLIFLVPHRSNGKLSHVHMETKKEYLVEQFKIKIIKPSPDRECITRLMQYSYNARRFSFQITFHYYIYLVS